MHMPHAVISGRKTVTVQIPGMSYDEIRAGRRNIEYCLRSTYWKTKFCQISPGEPFQMRLVSGAFPPLLFECASYAVVALRNIEDVRARCALQAQAMKGWLDETDNVSGAEPPVYTAYAIALVERPGPT